MDILPSQAALTKISYSSGKGKDNDCSGGVLSVNACGIKGFNQSVIHSCLIC